MLSLRGVGRRCGTLLRRPLVALAGKQTASICCNVQNKRFISSEPEKKFTKLNSDNDKNRDTIFQYTWGTWLKNDAAEKRKRTTRFSIEGLNAVLNEMYTLSKNSASVDSGADSSAIPAPVRNEGNGTVSLPHNTIIPNLDVLNANERQVVIKTISSIHEGKHHRVYKLSTNVESTPLILRIPYAIDPIETISTRLKSEVATQDYLQNNLGVSVPKIYVYGSDNKNPLGVPFMLQEFIEGDLLMKSWDPLADDASEGKPPAALQKVVNQMADLHSKVISGEFGATGSIYFKDDVPEDKRMDVIDGRWCIGPITERSFWKHKLGLRANKDVSPGQFLGPWDGADVTAIVKNLGGIEAANARGRLSLIDAGSSSEADKKGVLREQVSTFENLSKIAPCLFDSSDKAIASSKIPNLQEMMNPRLYLPDLDPLNVIVDKKSSKLYLLDFEGSCVKPFILQNSPKFIEYEGPKIYDIKKEIPDFDQMNDNEKAQCQFIYKRTRNQYLWENALNERHPDLIISMAPPIKLLRSAYVAALERKTDDGYLIVDENLLQLKQVWGDLYKNGLVPKESYPLEYTEEQTAKHAKDINALHQRLISSPFAATQGWIPQDMFESLVRGGLVIKDEHGNYKIKTAAGGPTDSEHSEHSENSACTST
ncbi:Aim9p KNAG_0L01740 [Huiozyma naganishii CBS 8797]|uniref:Altered inheritance of mitochondria protein 9, mitochondrial n=1 Tax=Huiozyma naganishii (strain ATCC MYA-139 / BCRC 22969 / CBS 8797 / KCTC 17520 / NBRC 10181 / NCYC 3082 / Yp74L-3) TaxID=1071383 RepID=J7SAJ2_HUIN7|nr:hypothetical protein KNAG_0L01740 [Kazachstania naganishii CBS 8797]CCK72794.1 hypothetical protein KNAG_0L01740 [Kazachstania naganishii CBS 8797]